MVATILETTSSLKATILETNNLRKIKLQNGRCKESKVNDVFVSSLLDTAQKQ